MPISNFHSHCNFCDGRASMEQFVQYAVAKKLSAFGVSSHAPVPFASRWAMKADDMPEYIQEFNRLKKLYATKIELYLGLEIDYFANEKMAVFDAVKNVGLDYRIGSIHHIDNFPDGTRWNIDGSEKVFKLATEQIYNNDVRKIVRRYFELSEEMLCNASFDIIGHLDKIVPNASQFAEFSIADKWYNNLMLSLLTTIKEKQIIVEINTKSFLGRGITFPNQQYFKKINELKIPVMVNSDCHYPDLLTAGFNEVYVLLKDAGIKSVITRKANKWLEVGLV
ncbi:MAG: histidinol-phosphatase [Paludibacteraceae bacterium]|nr:histidinol-phosphatase [Paludibacteraceae bacterium]MBN2787652.1 histidinol-phosphatase [Paludibacteraceae bacterium]